MARIVPVGEPENDSERRVIAHLRDHAPDDWTVLHNVEIPRGRQRYEIDLIAITPHAVYVMDAKGTRGQIEVVRNKWYPDGRQPFTSPVPKLRHNARALSGLFSNASPQLSQLFVDALVVLEADNANLLDPDDRDIDNVVKLTNLVDTLSNVSRLPSRFDTSGLGARPEVERAILGTARRPSGPRRYGNWEIAELLGENDDYTEYRARRAVFGNPARLKVFRLDPYLDSTGRRHQQLRVGNAYATLSKLPPHRNIVSAQEFFTANDDQAGVLVLDDPLGDALRVLLNRSEKPLSMDAKLPILRGITLALAHAHEHQVIHRALSPETVLIGPDHRPMLTGFDHARQGERSRPYTVAQTVPSVVDARYIAPEGHENPGALDRAGDVYALGVLAFELFTGEPPFADAVTHYRSSGRLPDEELTAVGVHPKLVEWIRSLCATDPAQRPSASTALVSLASAISAQRGVRGPRARPSSPQNRQEASLSNSDWDALRSLAPDHQLTPKYIIRRRLGSGSFGVAYLVHDVLARTDRVLKLVLEDEDSVVNRLLQEYRNLIDLPPHHNVVQARDADFLREKVPFLVMEYVPGKDLGELVKSGELGPADVRRLGVDIASGLAHVHAHGVHHCDIKPRNLLWSEQQGGVIIDFNVAVGADQSFSEAGLSKKYLPPDIDPGKRPDSTDLIDRDVYALGLSLYEALTGTWPWTENKRPPADIAPTDPRKVSGSKDLHDLSAEFVDVLLKAIQPSRADRYSSAEQFLQALNGIRSVRVPQVSTAAVDDTATADGGHSPFVSYLQTLYSQSPKSNSGTRGLDQSEFDIYVPTALDERLISDVLHGRHRLVIITGNAGDGKTAFLERLVSRAREEGAEIGPPRGNGHDFSLRGRAFHTNLDGSQDEGDRDNSDVLSAFFAPYADDTPVSWPDNETRLIAVNEGRLIDFLSANRDAFPLLLSIVDDQRSAEAHGVALVNLNARSVVVRTPGGAEEEPTSIFDRVLRRMTHERHWSDCSSCPLADKCYALHNARTFAHPTAGPRISARLRTLYELSHLRGKLHITLRDLRSALAYTLTSGRNCAEIHELYQSGDTEEILSGFYFNSWAGPPEGAQDRLLSLLRESDVSANGTPSLDRRLGFIGPSAGSGLMTLDQRGDYDEELLDALFERLPRSSAASVGNARAHRSYITSARRRYFFETQDDGRSAALLPYRSAEEFEQELNGHAENSTTVRRMVHAINRSEGLADPAKLGDALALAVRQVKGATIRSYRLFPLDRFSLEPAGPPTSRYVEGGPDRLVLRFRPEEAEATRTMLAHPPKLVIRLDLFEMLHRLGLGGFPSNADVQGHHLSLMVFKNMLTAAPYQEVLLTVTGHDVHQVTRSSDGALTMAAVDGSGDNESDEE